MHVHMSMQARTRTCTYTSMLLSVAVDDGWWLQSIMEIGVWLEYAGHLFAGILVMAY